MTSGLVILKFGYNENIAGFEFFTTLYRTKWLKWAG
jgi:hypothetical protein